jgi:hypothetical protein
MMEPRRRRRLRALLALALALSLHGGALLWLASVAATTALPPLREIREDIRVTVRFPEATPPPPPLSPPLPSDRPTADRRTPAPPALPREVARRRGVEAPAAPARAPSSLPPPSPPPSTAAPQPAPTLSPPADFPRHAWGAPPAVDNAPVRPVPLAPGDDRATPKVPRRQRTPSLLSRVMGAGATSVLGAENERKLMATLTDDTPPPTPTTEGRVKAWGTYDGQPGDGLSPGRKLARSARGGFVWVDEETGELRPDGPQPKHTGWERRFSNTGANLGLTFPDSTRPRPVVVDKDDLVPTDDGGYAYERDGWSARIFPDGAVRFDDDILSYTPGEAPALYERLGHPGRRP